MSTPLHFSISPSPKLFFPPRSHWSSLKFHPPSSPLLPLLTPHAPTPTPTPLYAGRKKNPPSTSGRIEGNAEIRRQAKQNARRRSRRLAENLFYRRNKNSTQNSADSFTEDELQAIGLGYDRYVRFMKKDDPNLRHPYDWYKYGKYGPYSWRGIVVGPPIRGSFSDDRVSLISEVATHEEWDEIEQFDMETEFDIRLQQLDRSAGFRYYWVFVRHPKWKASELPWQQWTLVCEVAVEAKEEERLDKWSLMGRFGNKTRAMVTRCAAWQRPDIIYVKRPVYQCRFEPQDNFFDLLAPLVDPETVNGFMCELRLEDGRMEACTYFGGLCKIVKVNPKAYVDDVVKGYMKLSDEGKSRCLEFLLTNHPMELLHPYTKEWKVKLEELELGCDAPDGSDDDGDDGGNDWDEEEQGESDDDNDDEEDQVIDVGEDGDEEEEGESDDDDNTDDDDDDNNEEEDQVIDVGDDGDEEEVRVDPEETPEYWDNQWKKAMRSSGEMEKLVAKTMDVSDNYYEQKMMEEKQMEERRKEGRTRRVDGDSERGDNWESQGYRGPRRKLRKRRIPPELLLRAAVRPFTYRNLVKEIVLMRHAIVDGDIKRR